MISFEKKYIQIISSKVFPYDFWVKTKWNSRKILSNKNPFKIPKYPTVDESNKHPKSFGSSAYNEGSLLNITKSSIRLPYENGMAIKVWMRHYKVIYPVSFLRPISFWTFSSIFFLCLTGNSKFLQVWSIRLIYCSKSFDNSYLVNIYRGG